MRHRRIINMLTVPALLGLTAVPVLATVGAASASAPPTSDPAQQGAVFEYAAAALGARHNGGVDHQFG